MHFAPASARIPAVEGGSVVLRDIEDLHDADLDLLLADRLAESADVLRAVVMAADVARDVARPAALGAHTFGSAVDRLLQGSATRPRPDRPDHPSAGVALRARLGSPRIGSPGVFG